jgi:hypothetical protein
MVTVSTAYSVCVEHNMLFFSIHSSAQLSFQTLFGPIDIWRVTLDMRVGFSCKVSLFLSRDF